MATLFYIYRYCRPKIPDMSSSPNNDAIHPEWRRAPELKLHPNVIVSIPPARDKFAVFETAIIVRGRDCQPLGLD